MANSARVSKHAVALVVVGGGIWVTTSYPPSAIPSLAWDDLYANLYIATIGILAIVIGLKGFRRGEKWAWYAIAVFVLVGVLTGLLDYPGWGGWYTSLFLGLLPLLGLLLSARAFFSSHRDNRVSVGCAACRRMRGSSPGVAYSRLGH